MSPNERNAWVRLVVILIVFIPYFAYVRRVFGSGGNVARAICIAFVVAALAHALLNAIAQGLMGSVFGCVKTDERDRTIDAISLRVAYFALVVLVLGALSTVAWLAFLTPSIEESRFREPNFSATSQFVFLCVVAAEALRHVTQVWCYRRAAT